MSIVKANQLVREGKFKEAESMYKSLYNKTKLEMYRFGMEHSRRKQKENSSIKYNSNLNSTDAVNEERRILFITAGLKGPTAGGGIATCFHSMVKTMGMLSTTETDVLYIAHPYYSQGTYESWKNSYKEYCNANFIVINVDNKNYGTKEMKRSHAILEYLMENEGLYDRVVFHDFMGLAYYTVLAKKFGVGLSNTKVIISGHGNHMLSNFFGKKKVDSWHTKAILFMERMSLKYADEVTSPSSFYKDWLSGNLEIDKNKIVVLPNIIYTSDSKEKIDVTFKDDTKKLLVFYGRIERLKGIDLLIEAIKKSNSKQVVHNILIAGLSTKIDGLDAKDYIAKALTSVNCEVQYKFNCQPTEVFNYIKENKGTCILPTLGENAPCIVVECILHGVPFLASDIPGIKEMVSDKYHSTYLFQTGSLLELTEKIQLETPAPTDSVLSYNMQQNELVWVDYLSQKSNQLVVLPSRIKDQKRPLISVVIPTCDRPELLEAAVESIYNQSYSNFEIIIVDDASVDSELNRSVASKYSCSYVYLSDKSYKGLACNTAVEYAKGEYICFFDDDDIAHPDMLDRYVVAFNRSDVNILSGFCEVFEHGKSYTSTSENYYSLALGGGLEVNLSINMFGKGSFIIDTQSFKEIGGYEVDESAVPMVDYRFYIKASLMGADISIIPQAQYFYRKNSPKSLYYLSGNNRTQQFLAKTSIQNILERKLGRDVGKAISPMVWDVSLPHYK